MNFLTFGAGDGRKSPETGRQVLDNSTSAQGSQALVYYFRLSRPARAHSENNVVSFLPLRTTDSGKNTVC